MREIKFRAWDKAKKKISGFLKNASPAGLKSRCMYPLRVFVLVSIIAILPAVDKLTKSLLLGSSVIKYAGERYF